MILEKKVRWPKVWDIVYMHILNGWWDWSMFFRMLWVTFVIPCPECRMHRFFWMIWLFAWIKLWMWRFSFLVWQKWILWLELIAFVQNNIVTKSGNPWLQRCWEDIALYINQNSKQRWLINKEIFVRLYEYYWQ